MTYLTLQISNANEYHHKVIVRFLTTEQMYHMLCKKSIYFYKKTIQIKVIDFFWGS